MIGLSLPHGRWEGEEWTGCGYSDHRVAEWLEESEPENSRVQGAGPQSWQEETSGDERTNTSVREHQNPTKSRHHKRPPLATTNDCHERKP